MPVPMPMAKHSQFYSALTELERKRLDDAVLLMTVSLETDRIPHQSWEDVRSSDQCIGCSNHCRPNCRNELIEVGRISVNAL